MNEYIEMINNKDYKTLANIDFIDELIKYKYQDKYLIEYLLEQGIHSDKMDNYLKYNPDFVEYYLKYNVIKPLLNCSLKVLFKKIDNNLIIDLILDKLNDSRKIKLYYNFRKTSYNDFHYFEREIIDIYLRHGIILPIMFISTKLDKINDVLINESLIDEFQEVFKETDIKLLNFMINEFKRCLLINPERTINDLQKLIKLKKENPKFQFIDTRYREGEEYDKENMVIKTNTNDSLLFNHELSHLLFQSTNENNDILEQYELIRKKIDTEENYIRIQKKLLTYHEEFKKLKKNLEIIYLDKINEFYGSFNNYLKKIYLDMKKNQPELLELWNIEKKETTCSFDVKFNLKEIVSKYVYLEKLEYVYINARKIFSPYLMLENMIDAILHGALFDNKEFGCLSGHGSFYFAKNKNNSFDECLANYDAIKKSDQRDEIIKILKDLIGEELITFLDKYIKENREVSYAK